jgi:hypothetical protein
MNIAVATYPRLYVRLMKKHELELVTSTCTMSCNVLLHDCTRHKYGMLDSTPLKVPMASIYTLSGRKSSIRSRQDGLDVTGTHDITCYPRIRELHVHVYKPRYCICDKRHQQAPDCSDAIANEAAQACAALPQRDETHGHHLWPTIT